MKIYEITEAIRPEHIPILNRMKAAGDKKSAVLANLIQSELQKANVPWDVAAELARDRYRDMEDKKRQNQATGKGKYTHYRDGTSRAGSTAQPDKPSNIRTKQDKTFSTGTPSLAKLDRGKGSPYKTYDLDQEFGAPVSRTKAAISRGAAAVQKSADDKSKSVIRRTPAKIAGLGIDAFKKVKKNLTPPKN